MKKRIEKSQNPFGNKEDTARFGYISGAIWIAAIAGFIVPAITAVIKFSWLTLVTALIVQLAAMTVLTKIKANSLQS